MALSPGLARWLITQGHDAVHAANLGLHSAPDTDIIARFSHVLGVLSETDIVQSIIAVDRDRIRRRRLPIV